MNSQKLWKALWVPFRIYRKSALALSHLLERSARFNDPMAVHLSAGFPALLKRNLATAGSQQGRRCFIFGSGPSFGQVNLADFRCDISIGVNGFFKHSQAPAYQPTHYCLSPDFFFDGSDTSKAFLKELLETITQSDFYVPYFPSLGHAERIIAGSWLPLERTFFIPHNASLVSDEIKRVDFFNPLPGGVNIIHEALLTAFHLGCNPIYLLGVEHDWMATRSNYSHFYNSNSTRHPSFRGLDQWTYYEKLRGAEQTWGCYLTILKYARQHGIRIVNLTPHSFLDVFEMEQLSDVVKA